MTSPRILIIGAGSRGHAYARAIHDHTSATIVGIAEPIAWKCEDFKTRYCPTSSLIYHTWEEILIDAERVKSSVDGLCVCTQDETHFNIVSTLRPLSLHLLIEKPLTSTLPTTLRLLSTLTTGPPVITAIGHVLRYSPHNILLSKLLPQIGTLINVNHTEPVGHFHFAHSYVRGNWRSELLSGPSLLTKCCHDVDLLLWWMCEGGKEEFGRKGRAHEPARISSHGSLSHFKKARKPKLAGDATNCFSCPAEPKCIYSAKRIYIDNQLKRRGNVSNWPNKIVVPELADIEDSGVAEIMLEDALRKDYSPSSTKADLLKTPVNHYGRCVYEAGNDVVDNQVVTISWDDEDEAAENGYGEKTATLTMIAQTDRICERFTKFYGSEGEITADSREIRVVRFDDGVERVYRPGEETLDEKEGHGGGDVGLARAFVGAVKEVLEGGDVGEAQRRWVRCTIEEAVRSHEVVWAAEEARKGSTVVRFGEWRERVRGELEEREKDINVVD